MENPPSPATDNLNETNMDTSYPTFETDKKPVKSSKGNRLRRSQIALGLGLTLFVLIVSALVGFLAYQNKKLKNLPPQVSSYDECANIEGSIIQESYPAICVTPDGRRFVQQLSEEEQKNLENQIDTSDWKTYRNEEYGFEFKYPTTILQQTNNGSQVNNKNIILAKFKTKDNKAIEVLFDYGSVFSIDYLKKYAPTGSEDLDPEKLIFGNNIFYYYGPGGGGVCYPDQFFHDYKGKIFILNFFGCENDKQPPESTKIIERQILSTFKFLDDEEAPVPTLTSQAKDGCVIGGCSGEICAEEEMASACIFNPKFECYKTATCERQSDGNCGWTETEKLASCLEEN